MTFRGARMPDTEGQREPSAFRCGPVGFEFASLESEFQAFQALHTIGAAVILGSLGSLTCAVVVVPLFPDGLQRMVGMLVMGAVAGVPFAIRRRQKRLAAELAEMYARPHPEED